MSEYALIDIDELSGPALDWAVAKVEGFESVQYCGSLSGIISVRGGGVKYPDVSPANKDWSPTEYWEQCGPLIGKYWMLVDVDDDGEVEAKAHLSDGSHHTVFAHEPKTAICRAVVAVRAKAAYCPGERTFVCVPEEIPNVETEVDTPRITR